MITWGLGTVRVVSMPVMRSAFPFSVTVIKVDTIFGSIRS